MLSLIVGIAIQSTAPAAGAGKWVVNYEDENCSVSRDLGLAAGGSYFGFYPGLQFLSGQVVVVFPDEAGANLGRVTAQFDGGDRSIDGIMIRQKIDGVQRRAVKLILTTEDVSRSLARSTMIAITLPDGRRMTARFGPTRAALDALTTCQAHLMKEWGVDPTALMDTSEVKTAIKRITDVGYPRAALRKGAEGRTVAIAAVDRNGRAISCGIAVSAGNPALDEHACLIARRLYLSKARSGQPATRWLVLPVRWAIFRP